MTDEEFDDFHGERQQRGLKDFFDEGTVMKHECTPGENPYWEETKKIYFEQPPKLQKTYKLTVVFYQRLKRENKELFHKSEPKKKNSDAAEGDVDDGDDEPLSLLTGRRMRKRKIDAENGGDDKKGGPTGPKRTKTTNQEPEPKNKAKDSNSQEVAPSGPLLQLPTGSAKVYTRLSADQSCVWKGPYRRERMNLVLFFHNAMKTVLGDPHTLDIQCREPYLVFPILKGAGVKEIEITKKDFTDVIAKKEVKDGEFVLRESLGVKQCHKLGADRVKEFSISFWGHFVWRFCLNVGDSGLYNAITDDQLSFLFGIDMEEHRNRVAEKHLVGFLFSKAPAKPYVQEIWKCLKAKKAEFSKLVNKALNYAGLDKLARMYDVTYDRSLFIERIKLVREAVSKL